MNIYAFLRGGRRLGAMSFDQPPSASGSESLNPLALVAMTLQLGIHIAWKVSKQKVAVDSP